MLERSRVFDRGHAALSKRQERDPKGGGAVVWDFLQRYDESWIWRRADRHQVTESTRNFAVLEECIADAVRHGYRASNAKRKDNNRLQASARAIRNP